MKKYANEGSRQEMAETALSVVMAKWVSNKIIAERNELLKENQRLSQELSQLEDDMFNQCPPATLRPDPQNAEFIVASYVGARHFRIPQDADRSKSIYIRWGMLHYWTNDGDKVEKDSIYDDITDSMEFDKWPTAKYWVGREQYIEYAGDLEVEESEGEAE